MASKRYSTAGQTLEFLRSDILSREEKCKEFWKYLDEKNLLPPYKPPKLTEDGIQGCLCANSTVKPSGKGPSFPCKNTSVKPKRPVNKETKPKKDFQQEYIHKMYRTNTKPEKCEQSSDSLLAEKCDYEKHIGQVITCQLCHNAGPCVSDDDDCQDDKLDEKQCRFKISFET